MSSYTVVHLFMNDHCCCLSLAYLDDDLRKFIWELGKEGFVLQLISLAGLHSNAVGFGTYKRDLVVYRKAPADHPPAGTQRNSPSVSRRTGCLRMSRLYNERRRKLAAMS